MGVVWGELEHGVRGLIMKEEIDKRVNKTTFASNHNIAPMCTCAKESSNIVSLVTEILMC